MTATYQRVADDDIADLDTLIAQLQAMRAEHGNAAVRVCDGLEYVELPVGCVTWDEAGCVVIDLT